MKNNLKGIILAGGAGTRLIRLQNLHQSNFANL